MSVNEIFVDTSVGKFSVVKPKAGKRNRAVVMAESSTGVIKQAKLMVELLPKCINSRPESFDKDVPIEHVLDDLEIDDYDKLADALSDMLEGKDEDEEEKKTSSDDSLKQEQ